MPIFSWVSPNKRSVSSCISFISASVHMNLYFGQYSFTRQFLSEHFFILIHFIKYTSRIIFPMTRKPRIRIEIPIPYHSKKVLTDDLTPVFFYGIVFWKNPCSFFLAPSLLPYLPNGLTIPCTLALWPRQIAINPAQTSHLAFCTCPPIRKVYVPILHYLWCVIS